MVYADSVSFIRMDVLLAETCSINKASNCAHKLLVFWLNVYFVTIRPTWWKRINVIQYQSRCLQGIEFV
jgi:hypothetical protein